MIVLTSGLHSQNPYNKFYLAVDSLYSVFNDSERPGCAIAIVKGGETIYQNCFGLADIEHQIPISDSTLFNLASVSKQFTGYGVAKLVTESKLHPNSAIGVYLQNENKLWDSIQLKNLIHHTSGVWEWPYLFLAAGYSFNDVLNHQSIYKIIKSQSNLNFRTGSKYQYASSNYVLLGEIISKVTDTNYFDWVSKNVFQPAGMSKTVFQKNHSDLIKNRAHGYLYKNNQYYRTTNNFSSHGTGSIYTNISDMACWIKHLLHEYSQNNLTISQMLQIDTLNNGDEVSYAYGLVKKGEDCYWHDGFFQGFRNITIMYPEQNFALILLSNSGSNYIVRSAFTVSEMFLTDSIQTEKNNKLKQQFNKEPQRKRNQNTELIYLQDLNEFKGIFFNSELLITYRIYENGDSLFAENTVEKILLKPIESNIDKFSSDKFLLGDFIFKRNDYGKVNELYIKQKRNNNIRFRKIEEQ